MKALACGSRHCTCTLVLLAVLQMVSQRANIFTVFLVIPTGFLRALASKQVQLEEDDDSDGDSDAGDLGEIGRAHV